VRILLDEDLQLDQLDQYLQRAGVLTLPIIKLQKCKDIRITQKNNSDNNDHLQNNRNLKVAKIIHHLSTSSTHKKYQKSLFYINIRQIKNDPKGSLKYVKFTFVKFLTISKSL